MTYSDWLAKNGYDEAQLTAMQSEHLGRAWRQEEDIPGLAQLRDERRLGPMILSPRPGIGPEMADVLAASLAVSIGTAEADVGRLFGEPVANVAFSKEHRGASFHSIMRTVLQAHGE